MIYTPDGRPLDTSTAIVTLAHIPFVRLRDGLQETLLEPGASFSEVVAQAQRNLAAPDLTLDSAHCQVRCGETVLTLPPIDFACYAWLARQALASQPGVCRNRISAADTAEFLAEYQALQTTMDQDIDRVRVALNNGMESAYFDGRLTGIRKALVRALGTAGTRPYLIHSDKKRPLSRYALTLKPEQIRFEAVTAA